MMTKEEWGGIVPVGEGSLKGGAIGFRRVNILANFLFICFDAPG